MASTTAAAAAPAPVVTAPTGVVAPSPLVYQQLASGQIQMYQLPPGYVPVLVSNTGSLQPLVSLPPQPQIPQPQVDSLGVPSDNNSRRSSSNLQGYEYAAPTVQMMIVPEQNQQPQPQPQTVPQPQMVQGTEYATGQPQIPMEYASNQPQIPMEYAPNQPQMVSAQPQMVPVTEAYTASQPPVVPQEAYVPQETYVQPPPTPEPFVPDTYVQPQMPTEPLTVEQPQMVQPLVQPTEPQTVEEVQQQPLENIEQLAQEPEVDDSGLSVVSGSTAVVDDLEAVDGEDCLEDGELDSVKPDVSGLPQPTVVPHVGYVVHPAHHVHHVSASLYSSTSSLSSSCDYLHAYKHSISVEEAQYHQQPQQPRKTSVPNTTTSGGPMPNHAGLMASDALLRRGSLPHTILLMKQDPAAAGGLAPGLQAGGHHYSPSSTSRRSSSGAIVPLATLREKAGDSDMSNEDLSQVSLGQVLNNFCLPLFFLRLRP